MMGFKFNPIGHGRVKMVMENSGLSRYSLSAILSINWPQPKSYIWYKFMQIGHDISSEIFKTLTMYT
jgi:hypothetical protein